MVDPRSLPKADLEVCSPGRSPGSNAFEQKLNSARRLSQSSGWGHGPTLPLVGQCGSVVRTASMFEGPQGSGCTLRLGKGQQRVPPKGQQTTDIHEFIRKCTKALANTCLGMFENGRACTEIFEILRKRRKHLHLHDCGGWSELILCHVVLHVCRRP